MKRFIFILIICCGFIGSHAQQSSYTNPILAGFYPDPSICRVGDDYYLTTSTFVYYPGLPIFHSKDLVSWKQIGNAIDRPEQMDFNGAGVSRGLFAPAITYHKGIYYIVCTQIDKLGNFVITAKDPKGPWSNPAAIPVDGIDPSLYFDENDKAYLVYNSIPPDNKPMHDGHRTIRMYEFDWKNLKLKGEEKLLVNGGTDMAKKPVWIEAPHILKKDGYYYLICAEGGTAYNHSEVVFRSKQVDGPYLSYENNPILTQRDLDRSRPDPITTTGHADFVQTKQGEWYAVFLGCRPYEDDYYNTGRETFMAPVTWSNGWPHILKRGEVLKYSYPLPNNTKGRTNDFSGNFTYKASFGSSNSKLDPRFLFLRTVKQKWYNTSKGKLVLNVRPEMISGKENPSFVGFRQSHLKCTSAVSLDFKPTAENEKAGLTIFQSEHYFYYLCKSTSDGKPVVQLYKSTETDELELLASEFLPSNQTQVNLRIDANGGEYDFYWSAQTGKDLDKVNWNMVKKGVDGKFLSTKIAKGFVGSIFAMYATSMGKPSSSKVTFLKFEYSGDDQIFRKSH